MTAASRMAIALMLAGSLSGCGVPHLYSAAETGARRDSPTPLDPRTDLAPKVHHIVDEIACELADVRVHQLKGRSFLVTVLLTLQVDDNLDVTPSLSLLRPLMGGAESESTTLSADVGGGRRRTFTTTYYLETDKLPEGCPARPGVKVLRLDGDLGLFEIARDGSGVLAQTAVHSVRSGKDDKALSTFGSFIQFTITRGVTGLGPTWTLKRFKGPSGQNGLVNGKRLNTDSVALTFAPVAPSAESERAETDLQKAMATRDQRHSATVAAAALRDRRREARDMLLRLKPSGRKQPGQMGYGDGVTAEKALSDATTALNQAADAEAEADAAVKEAAARKDAEWADRASATYAGQTLLNTILLQNLNIQPR